MHALTREGLALKLRLQGKNLSEIAKTLGVPREQASEITHFALQHHRRCARALTVKVFGTVTVDAAGRIVFTDFEFEYTLPDYCSRRPAQTRRDQLDAIAQCVGHDGPRKR